MSWFSRLIGKRTELAPSHAPISFTNTLSGRKETFIPLKPPVVTMYTCGPTVYGPAHIGNLRAYVFSDTIMRALMEAGYHVRRVINITDVGHLVGDGDHGEDKMEKGAREQKMSPAEIAERYTKLFMEDLRALNIDTEHTLFPRATEYIQEQIAMIKTLEEKGFAYRAEDGIYFDTSKFPDYGKLGGIDVKHLMAGARIEKIRGKRNATDFVLWRDAGPNDLQQWDSPWGRGNPGWHIECSAMSRSLLGIELDIHTGGIDHIPTHHNNEIAQSEGVSGRKFVRYWIHNAFLNIGEDKISKSLKNDYVLPDVVEHGIHPLALRYLFLQAHYRSPLSFTWEALGAAQEALKRLWRIADEAKTDSKGVPHDSDVRGRFIALVRDDLATPQAIAYLWDSLKGDDLSPEEKWGLITAADALLGLSLTDSPAETRPTETENLPEDIQKLVYERDLARGAKDYAKADELRYQLEERGYRVEDSASGTLLTKNP
jgi:cysteinyl-tRNA synthetase